MLGKVAAYREVKGTPRNWDTETLGKPEAVLQDESGGQSVINNDDGCFVLYNGSDNTKFGMSNHWYPEAAKVLGRLVAGVSTEQLSKRMGY